MKPTARILVLVLAITSAGCGGSGGRVTSAAPPARQPATATVSFRIVIPNQSSVGASASRRSPRYISASTQSASITGGPNGGSPGTPVVVNCTTVCTGQVTAPIGSDVFTVNLYDAQNAGGSLLSSGTTYQTIAAGIANSVNVTFNGVVASMSLSLNPSSVTAGVPTTVAVNFAALDPDGNTIIGPGAFANASGTPIAIVLSNSNPGLGTSSGGGLSTTTLGGPTTTPITFSYNGLSLLPYSETVANPVISASVNQVVKAQATLTVLLPTEKIYSANYGGNTVTVYPAGVTGNVTPVATIGGTATGLNQPQGIAVDAAGNIYVANNGNNTVEVFAPNANGNVAPTSTISGTNTGLNAPTGLALDAAGNIYVSNSASVKVFAAGASGNATPTVTIAGSNTGFNLLTGIAVDANGKIYVSQNSQSLGGGAEVFAAGASGNVAPTASVTYSSVFAGIAVAPNGQIYGSAGDAVEYFAANPSGTVSTRLGDVTEYLANAYGLAIDGQGQVYVSQLNGSVIVFPPGATGSSEPIVDIAGSNTGLNQPLSVAIH